MLKKLIANRPLLQALSSILFVAIIAYFHLSLLQILLLGALSGIIFGKVFCRWLCPIGFLVELLFRRQAQRNQQLYMYHKAGCPIAWISGLLNKYSMFRIFRAKDSCTSCGKCDQACYVSSLDSRFSLYKNRKQDPSLEYSCSRCFDCVKECPNQSLHVGLAIPK